MDVSVIVASFNPIKEKLIRTIFSISKQAGVLYEVILADDGSEVSFCEEALEFSQKNKLNLKIVKNKKNQGTIKNILSGVKVAEGKYIYVTSPGDFLYDENTLSIFYKNALNNPKTNIFFGKAINYFWDDEKLNVESPSQCVPRRPQLFNCGSAPEIKKIAFFFGNSILGAAYFRERKSFEKYLKISCKIGKYAEDRLTTAIALLEDEDILFVDRNIVWYEKGTGISTSGDTKWNCILQEEYQNLIKYIEENYDRNSLTAEIVSSASIKNKYLRLINRIIKHPKVYFIIQKNKKIIIQYSSCGGTDVSYLKKIIDCTGDSYASN